MQVADTNSLALDANVLLRGVPVGKVTGIETSVDSATIDFYIEDTYRVPVDSDVRLENLSALGESYIGLVPRSPDGPVLQDGQRIATERVIQPASISELSVATMRLFTQLDPGALQRIVGEVDTALPDPISVLPNLSRTSVLLRNVAAGMHGTGRDLLDNFQTLLRNADWVGPLFADIAPGVRKVGYGGGLVFAGLAMNQDIGAPHIQFELNRFLGRIQKLLDDNSGDLKVLGEALQPQLKGIAGALMNFDTGQILSNFLASVPADGAITLHVAVPPN